MLVTRWSFSFDANAVKNSNHRRKALSVTVTHVREFREEINTRDARNDIKGVRDQKVQRGLRNDFKSKSAVVASVPCATVAKAVPDTIDDKVLERLAVVLLKFMGERLPPPLPPPPAPRI